MNENLKSKILSDLEQVGKEGHARIMDRIRLGLSSEKLLPLGLDSKVEIELFDLYGVLSEFELLDLVNEMPEIQKAIDWHNRHGVNAKLVYKHNALLNNYMLYLRLSRKISFTR